MSSITAFDTPYDVSGISGVSLDTQCISQEDLRDCEITHAGCTVLIGVAFSPP